MKFGENDHDKDSDRRAWRVYAAAALPNCLRVGLQYIDSDNPTPNELISARCRMAGEYADAMLAEERKRR